MKIEARCEHAMPHQSLRPSATHPSSLIRSLLMHAAVRPDAPAVVELLDGGRTCTWAELMTLTARRASTLRQQLKVGQVVITVLPSGIESVGWFCGAIAAGVRVLPMHAQVAPPEAIAAIARVDPRAAVVATGIRSADVLSHLASLLPEEDGSRLATGEFPTDAAGAVILESSGTSGLPKLVLRESGALDAVADNVTIGMNLCTDDRIVFPTPLSHSYGVDVLVAAMTSGATLCVMNQYDPERVAREIESVATILLGTPFIYESLGRQSSPRTSALRIALSAGSPLLESVRRRFYETWSVEIGQLYGATEFGTVAMSVPGSDIFSPGSIGRPLPGVEMSLMDVDEPSRKIARGKEGQLLVRAPSMLTGCLNGTPDIVNGHLLTGDLAREDDAGRFWITGRLKLMVDVGGYKVNPLEVEGVLATHPAIAEAIVIPLVQSPTICRLRAVVVLRDDASSVTSDQLRAFLKDRLSATKVPRIVNIVDSLPKSSTGKILRDQIMSNWS